MSRNEWEEGTITIPSAAWAGFKKNLRTAYNEALAQDFASIERMHADIKTAIKGKRGVDIQAVVREHVFKERPRPAGAWRIDHGDESSMLYPLNVVNTWTAQTALLSQDEDTKKYRLKSPKKSAFKPADGKTKSFNAGGEASITLNDENRTVTWRVSENNHACDHARESFMGKVLFKELGRVQWTRGSGGAIHGNDEYNEDSGREYAGGGGSYLKDRFGPAGEQEFERLHGFKPPKNSSLRRR